MIKGRPILSKEIIFSKISSEDIFREYCSPFKKIGEHFNSELRADPKPSAIIDWIRGDLMYSDFGDGLHIRAIEYVKQKFNIDYWDALEKIYNDFKLEKDETNRKITTSNTFITYSISISNTNSKYRHKSRENQPTIIRIKKRNFNSKDKQYWYDRYYISKKTLKKFNIIPISHFWINDKLFIADELCYCYNFYWDTKEHYARKIYQPFSKTNKWISNGGIGIVQGECMLPKSGELLIISKSLKDVLCYYNLGYSAIAPPSETSWIPQKYLEKQLKRFNKIIINFDQDSCGRTQSEKYSKEWNIPYILIPEQYKSKDLSDLIYNHGLNKAKEVINELIYK
jgi:hypothetical protein